LEVGKIGKFVVLKKRGRKILPFFSKGSTAGRRGGVL
jgi:hypothetical protein